MNVKLDGATIEQLRFARKRMEQAKGKRNSDSLLKRLDARIEAAAKAAKTEPAPTESVEAKIARVPGKLPPTANKKLGETKGEKK